MSSPLPFSSVVSALEIGVLPRSVIGGMSATAWVQPAHGFIVFKAYFDGGNQADSAQYKVLTLACVGATDSIWRDVEKSWCRVLKKYGAPYSHMYEAICGNGAFSSEHGWSQNKTPFPMIKELAHVLRGFRNRPIHATTCTVFLDDYKRASQEVANIPSPHFICIGHCLPFQAVWFGETVLRLIDENMTEFPEGCMDLFFDRGERFYGHVANLWNRKSMHRRPVWRAIRALTKADMKSLPGLQIADMIAWAHNRPHGEGGYAELCDDIKGAITDNHVDLKYDDLRSPNRDSLDALNRLKLPRSRPIR